MARPKLELRTTEERNNCCWCNAPIEPKQTAWGMAAKSVYDLCPRGRYVEVELLSGERIVGYVIEKGSEVGRQGYDIMFFVCSEKCDKALGVAISQNEEALSRDKKALFRVLKFVIEDVRDIK